VNILYIEYILIKDVNDKPEHAHELGQLLSSRRGHIILNLIPYNPTAVMESYEAPPQEHIDIFYGICTSDPYFILTRVRREMGQVVGDSLSLYVLAP
jgi:adenine C2-methylase RlmN of 23S rRNA A2503 and tRNA A37